MPAPPLRTRLFQLALERAGAISVPAQNFERLCRSSLTEASVILRRRVRTCSSSSLDWIAISMPVSRQRWGLNCTLRHGFRKTEEALQDALQDEPANKHPSLQIEVPQIIIHETHQPNVIVNFFDADGLSGKDLSRQLRISLYKGL
jgi:hypothetical protein